MPNAVGFEDIRATSYNWSELSIGDNTMSADNFFAAAKHPGHEKFVNNNIFEKKIDENDDENDQNAVNTHGSGAESTLSSSQEKPVEEVHRGYTKAVTKPKVFNVVESVKFYEERKKHRLAEIERKEREQRKFVAKPAPKFDSIHAAANQKRSASHEKLRVTIPVTPKVVHHHRQNIEKLKTKQEALKAELQPKPFVSRDADVMFQEPFVPQLRKKMPTRPVPFNLQSDGRLRERRQFDEQTKMEKERKEKEEEERRSIEEEVIRREIRKQTEFKAKPNPFA